MLLGSRLYELRVFGVENFGVGVWESCAKVAASVRESLASVLESPLCADRPCRISSCTSLCRPCANPSRASEDAAFFKKQQKSSCLEPEKLMLVSS